MKRSIKHLTFANLIFLALMIAASGFSGALFELAYSLSFALPAILLIFLNRDAIREPARELCIGKDGLIMLGALGAPSLILVAGTAYLSKLIFSSAGMQVPTTETDNPFILSVFLLAFLPALLEELLFRYLPMKLLLPYSHRVCVLLSAIMFSAAHRSAFSLTYALIAGVIFMVIDIGAGSILPSVILHFLNNLLSLTLSYYGSSQGLKIGLIVSLSLLLCGSIAVFVVYRKKIIEKIRRAFSAGESFGLNPIPLFFILPCILIAALELAA